MSLVPRTLVAGLVGAAATALGLVLVVAWRPVQSFEMDRDLPATATGFSPAERVGAETFIWSAPRAQMTLDGLDRRQPWSCRLRFRGGRPPGVVQPRVDVLIDGVTLTSVQSTNDYQEVDVLAPARPGSRGLTIGLFASETFRPGGADPRELGVLIDRLVCRPAGEAQVWPPPVVTMKLATSGALFAMALALTGLGLAGAVAGALGTAVALVLPFAVGPAPYTGYVDRVADLTFWTALSLIVFSRVLARVAGGSLDGSGRLVLASSAGLVLFKLLGLVHPSKGVVDAVYHAHRLEWVLSGRIYFTQIMPNGVEFPYAPALYVVAAPFALLTADHVMLLRVVIGVSEAAAAGLLYLMIVRVWGDRLAAALAAVLFQLTPLIYPVIGNANMTNAFGQFVALGAVAAAVLLPLAPGRPGQALLLTLLVLVAMLSHVSTLGLTLATLGPLAVLYWWLGGAALRGAARVVMASTVVAAVLAVGLYWGHFADTYQTLARVRADATAAAPAEGGASGRLESGAASDADAASRPARLVEALRLGLVDVGWPILLLAVAGAGRVWTRGRLDRLVLAIAAWGVAYVAFVGFAVLAPVSQGYERYAAEFVGRVDLAVYPAVVILAATGAGWLWRSGRPGRLAVGLALAACLVSAVGHWRLWLV